MLIWSETFRLFRTPEFSVIALRADHLRHFHQEGLRGADPKICPNFFLPFTVTVAVLVATPRNPTATGFAMDVYWLSSLAA